MLFLDGLIFLFNSINKKLIIKRTIYILFILFFTFTFVSGVHYYYQESHKFICNSFKDKYDVFLCKLKLDVNLFDFLSKDSLYNELQLLKLTYTNCDILNSEDEKADCEFSNIVKDAHASNGVDALEKCSSLQPPHRVECYLYIINNIMFLEYDHESGTARRLTNYRITLSNISSVIQSEKVLEESLSWCQQEQVKTKIIPFRCDVIFELMYEESYPFEYNCYMFGCKGWPLGLKILDEMPKRVFTCNKMLEPFRQDCFEALFKGFKDYKYVNVSLSEAYSYCDYATGDYKNECYTTVNKIPGLNKIE